MPPRAAAPTADKQTNPTAWIWWLVRVIKGSHTATPLEFYPAGTENTKMGITFDILGHFGRKKTQIGLA